MIKRKEHAPYSIRANLLPTKREKEKQNDTKENRDGNNNKPNR